MIGIVASAGVRLINDVTANKFELMDRQHIDDPELLQKIIKHDRKVEKARMSEKRE